MFWERPALATASTGSVGKGAHCAVSKGEGEVDGWRKVREEAGGSQGQGNRWLEGPGRVK